MKKRLSLSETDKKIAGVCGGIAEYFDVDSTIVRIVYALLTLGTTGFPGILLYLVMMFVVPRRNNYIDSHQQ
ncbi:MAG: PspC domain-containing protein [Bacteroidaceae bacterium]|nr:PspC domain-containing protein [Bacteroidaceae bacterium]